MLIIPIYTFLSKITNSPKKIKFNLDKKVYEVFMNRKKYKIFRENSQCVVCGIKADIARLEEYQGNHFFNIYAIVENKLVLMTQDHILPKSHGGCRHFSNIQVMCENCNNIKGNNHVAICDLRKLLDPLLSRKQQLELAKSFACLPRPTHKPDCMHAAEDIAIWRLKGELIGRSMDGNYPQKEGYVANIKYRTVIKPVGINSSSLYLAYNDELCKIPLRLIALGKEKK